MKIGLLFLLAFGTLTAMPSQPTVIEGEAHFNLRGSVLEVAVLDRAIIEWETFSIEEGETVRFLQPNRRSTLLNRVKSSDPSLILGRMEGNGQIVFVHSSGILFDSTAVVEARSFIGSTLDLQNSDYLFGSLIFDTPPQKPILQKGTILARRGDAILLGHCVENEGTVRAVGGLVALAGVGSATVIRNGLLATVGPVLPIQDRTSRFLEGIYEEEIHAFEPYRDNGVMKLFPRVVNKGIVSSARGKRGGEVYLLGTDVWLMDDSEVDVSGEIGGGSIYAGSGPLQAAKVFLGRESQLKADALMKGAGGTVFLFGNDVNQFLGTISVRGFGDGLAVVESNRFFYFLGTVEGNVKADLSKVSQIPSLIAIESPLTTLPTYYPSVQIPDPILPK